MSRQIEQRYKRLKPKRFYTEKESLYDRYKPLTRLQERVLMCWADAGPA